MSLVLFALALAASAERTSRGRLRPAPAAVSDTVGAGDVSGLRTVCSDSVSVSVKGYDKPLRSRRETFFIVNADTALTVERACLTITYFDMDGRMLHRRSENLDCEVPALETRRVAIPSWDTQRTFFFHLSDPPARAVGTPYQVTITVDSILCRNCKPES